MAETAGQKIGITCATRNGDYGIWANSYYTGFGQLDEIGYAAREDRNLVYRGGKFTWDSGTGQMAFNANFEIFNHITAFKNTITQATASPATLSTAGDIAYASIVRKPSTNNSIATLTVVAAGSLPNAVGSNGIFAVAYRSSEDTLVLPWAGKEILSGGDYYGVNAALTFYEYRAMAFKPTLVNGSTTARGKVVANSANPSCVLIDGKIYANTTDTVVDLDVSGVGGLDTGVKAGNTVYYVYATPSTGRTYALVVSLSASAPTGFSSYTRVDTFTTTAISTIDIGATTATSSGDVNYITNGGGQSGTTGFSLYNDGASAIPVDGTGGTATGMTLSTTTSSPLTGTASLTLDKDASNRQGCGVSYDFTIDGVYKGRMLTGKIQYAINSGTYADDDLQVFMYDVTNSVFIPCVPQKIKNVLGNDILTFEFQAAINSTSYRLIIHVTSTSASAYQLKFEASVSPSQVQSANNTAAFRAYRTGNQTVGPNNSSITIVPNTVDAGDDTHGGFNTTTGAYTIQVAGWYIFFARISIDNTNMLASTRYSAQIYINGNMMWEGEQLINTSAGTSVMPGRLITPQPVRCAIGDVVSIKVFGAGNNSVSQLTVNGGNQATVFGGHMTRRIENYASSRVVSFVAQRATDQTSVNPNGSAVKVTFATATKDTHGGFNTSTNRYVIQIPGVYTFGARIWVKATNVLANAYGALLYKNGSLFQDSGLVQQDAGEAFSLETTFADIDCAAGDYFEVFFWGSGNNSASNVTIGGGTAYATCFFGHLLQGPQQPYASETVAAQYFNNANTSVTSSDTDIPWATKSFDTHNGMNTSTGVYTAPVAGKYRVSCGLRFQATSMSQSDQVILQLFKASTLYATLFQYEVQTTQSVLVGVAGSTTISLLAGETIKIVCSSTTTALLSNSGNAQCHVAIERIGN